MTAKIPSVDAIEYGRRVLDNEIARLRKFEADAAADGRVEQSERWRYMARWLERMRGDGTGCVITAFDSRWLNDGFRAMYKDVLEQRDRA